MLPCRWRMAPTSLGKGQRSIGSGRACPLPAWWCHEAWEALRLQASHAAAQLGVGCPLPARMWCGWSTGCPGCLKGCAAHTVLVWAAGSCSPQIASWLWGWRGIVGPPLCCEEWKYLSSVTLQNGSLMQMSENWLVPILLWLIRLSVVLTRNWLQLV